MAKNGNVNRASGTDLWIYVQTYNKVHFCVYSEKNDGENDISRSSSNYHVTKIWPKQGEGENSVDIVNSMKNRPTY